MLQLIGKSSSGGIGSRSIVSMRWRGWKNFTLTADCLGRDLRCGVINGTRRVLIEYTKKVRNKGLILDPVDIKKDLYGFVYAPEPNSRGLYNPFPNASAYHQ